MPTKQQLIGALTQADAAGEYEDAKVIAEIIRGGRYDDVQQEPISTPQVTQPADNTYTGILEPAATMASSLIAEPIAGLAGLGMSLFPGEEGSGGQTVRDVREALTYQPRSTVGQQNLQAVGEFMAPVGEVVEDVEQGIGNKIYDLTGSPALAAAGTALPTAILEAIGFGVGRKVAKVSTGFSKAPPAVSEATKKQINAARVESVPDIELLKETSSKIYTELEDSGVALREKSFKSLVNKLNRTAAETNVDEILTPKTRRIVDVMNKQAARPGARSITEVDNLRKQLNVAASAIDPADKRAALILIDKLDDFLDTTSRSSFIAPQKADTANITIRLQAARKLWGRARRSEIIEQAMIDARSQASGFENGIRIQLRSILKNKNKRKYFSADELSAMRSVEQGSKAQNIFKFIGKMGFSEGQATQLLGTSLGAGMGFAIAGGGGAVAAPIIGQAAKIVSTALTKKGTTMVEALVKGGADSEEIIKAYLRSVPTKKRTPEKLAQMLVDPSIDLTALRQSNIKAIQDAAEIAQGRRAFGLYEGAGTATATGITGQENNTR